MAMCRCVVGAALGLAMAGGAQAGITVGVSSASGLAGETVTVSVTILSTEDVHGLQFDIDVDAAAELTAVTQGTATQALNGGSGPAQWLGSAPGGQSGAAYSLPSLSLSDWYDAGVLHSIVDLDVKIPNGATLGETFDVTLSDAYFTNLAATLIPFDSFTGGTVTVAPTPAAGVVMAGFGLVVGGRRRRVRA